MQVQFLNRTANADPRLLSMPQVTLCVFTYVGRWITSNDCKQYCMRAKTSFCLYLADDDIVETCIGFFLCSVANQISIDVYELAFILSLYSTVRAYIPLPAVPNVHYKEYNVTISLHSARATIGCSGHYTAVSKVHSFQMGRQATRYCEITCISQYLAYPVFRLEQFHSLKSIVVSKGEQMLFFPSHLGDLLALPPPETLLEPSSPNFIRTMALRLPPQSLCTERYSRHPKDHNRTDRILCLGFYL